MDNYALKQRLLVGEKIKIQQAYGDLILDRYLLEIDDDHLLLWLVGGYSHHQLELEICVCSPDSTSRKEGLKTKRKHELDPFVALQILDKLSPNRERGYNMISALGLMNDLSIHTTLYKDFPVFIERRNEPEDGS